MTDKQFEKLYTRVDRIDDRLWYLTVIAFAIMVGVCTQ